MPKKNLNLILFILLVTFWSGSFVAIKIVVTTIPPFFGAMLRVLTALISLMVIFYFAKRPTQVEFSVRWKMWLIGLFAQGFPFAFLFWGEQLITPGLAGILNGTVSIWAFLLSLLLFHEASIDCGKKMIGLGLGMAGIFIIFWPSIGSMSSNIWGALSVLFMAISYAVGAVLNQYLFSRKTKIDFYANLYHQHCSSLVFLFAIALIFEPLPSAHVLLTTPSIWLATLYLGVFSTAIAWMIYYHLIREWDAVRASTVMYVVPVMALLWDFLLFNNYPQISEIIGVTTILSGVILLQFNNLRRIKC